MLMKKTVTQEIEKDILESKYFSITVDSTPDISHCNQLSFIIWYVIGEGILQEQFLWEMLGILGKKWQIQYLNFWIRTN